MSFLHQTSVYWINKVRFKLVESYPKVLRHIWSGDRAWRPQCPKQKLAWILQNWSTGKSRKNVCSNQQLNPHNKWAHMFQISPCLSYVDLNPLDLLESYSTTIHITLGSCIHFVVCFQLLAVPAIKSFPSNVALLLFSCWDDTMLIFQKPVSGLKIIADTFIASSAALPKWPSRHPYALHIPMLLVNNNCVATGVNVLCWLTHSSNLSPIEHFGTWQETDMTKDHLLPNIFHRLYQLIHEVMSNK